MFSPLCKSLLGVTKGALFTQELQRMVMVTLHARIIVRVDLLERGGLLPIFSPLKSGIILSEEKTGAI